jgi:hypothetical protein
MLPVVALISQVVNPPIGDNSGDDLSDNEGGSKASKFNAEAHINLFQETFNCYGLTLE